jgi:hypothetical protein
MLVVILISCYARIQCNRMTFRTLTLAFGWNIMLRWNIVVSDLFPQFTWILFPRYCNHTHLVFHHPRHVAKTNNKTFAFDLLIQAGFSPQHHNNDQTFTKENVWEGPQRSALGEGGRDLIIAAEWGAELDGDFSETKILNFNSSPVPTSMCLLGSMMSMLHANNMMLFYCSTSCTAMLWSILVFSCTSSVLTFFSVVRSKETRRSCCTNWTLSRQSWRSAGWSPKGEIHRLNQIDNDFSINFFSS